MHHMEQAILIPFGDNFYLKLSCSVYTYSYAVKGPQQRGFFYVTESIHFDVET